MSQQPRSTAPEILQEHRFERIARGQKFIMVGMLLQIAVVAPLSAIGAMGVASLLLVAAFVICLIGLHRVASGLGFAIWKEVLLAVMLIIPLISLIVLATVSARATKTLRAAGYRVGLFGASRPGALSVSAR